MWVKTSNASGENSAQSLISALIEVNRHAVRAPVVDLEEPEGATKWGFVSGCMAGLRHRHDSLPKSKESQIRALEKGRHQHSSSLPTLVLTLARVGPDPANGGKC